MRNIVSFDTKVKCHCCKQQGFFCNLGSSYCPRCGDYLPFNEIYDTFLDKDIRNIYDFCDSCCIIFKKGCKHAENGCDASIYNVHLITKYEYYGNIYEGMPQFENEEEWLQEGPKIKVLEQNCINKGLLCPKASYPIDKHLIYYHECNLKQ